MFLLSMAAPESAAVSFVSGYQGSTDRQTVSHSFSHSLLTLESRRRRQIKRAAGLGVNCIPANVHDRVGIYFT